MSMYVNIAWISSDCVFSIGTFGWGCPPVRPATESAAAVQSACFLELQGEVLERELFCRFPVTDSGYPGRTLLLNINGLRDRRTSGQHRVILEETLQSLGRKVLSRDRE